MTRSAVTVLATLALSTVEAADAVSLGSEYRLVGNEVAGSALVADDRVVHLMVFPAPGKP